MKKRFKRGDGPRDLKPISVQRTYRRSTHQTSSSAAGERQNSIQHPVSISAPIPVPQVTHSTSFQLLHENQQRPVSKITTYSYSNPIYHLSQNSQRRSTSNDTTSSSNSSIPSTSCSLQCKKLPHRSHMILPQASNQAHGSSTNRSSIRTCLEGLPPLPPKSKKRNSDYAFTNFPDENSSGSSEGTVTSLSYQLDHSCPRPITSSTSQLSLSENMKRLILVNSHSSEYSGSGSSVASSQKRSIYDPLPKPPSQHPAGIALLKMVEKMNLNSEDRDSLPLRSDGTGFGESIYAEIGNLSSDEDYENI